MATQAQKIKIVEKYLTGGKLTRSEAATLGHIHNLAFGRKIGGRH